jgi:Fe2+ transport system protein B
VGKIPTLIIGNKADLEYHPSIIEKAETLCKKLGIELCLTSAKTGKNMLEIFEKLSLMLLEIS